MRRVLWVAVGAVVGVLAVRAVSRRLAQLSPEAMGGVLGQAAEAWEELSATVREAMAERETELRSALGIDHGGIEPETEPEPAPLITRYRPAAKSSAEEAATTDPTASPRDASDSDRAPNEY